MKKMLLIYRKLNIWYVS